MIGGAGRTNLNPYWNLGFDPNDYVQFGTGYRNNAGDVVSAFAIHDNRLGTGQTNTHLYFRHYLRKWRLTLDVVNEHGNGEGGLVVRAWSTSLDVDWRRWFVRVADDPHVNYTADRQVRIAGGVRFLRAILPPPCTATTRRPPRSSPCRSWRQCEFLCTSDNRRPSAWCAGLRVRHRLVER